MVAPLIISRARVEAGPERPEESGRSGASPVDSEFAHMLAHDLRSPLTAIQMCADALFAGAEAAARERYAALIADQARVIAWSLEDLVALADCEAWRGVERRRVDLAALADRCLDELAGVAAACDITVVPDGRRESVHAWGVEPALEQAVRGCARAVLDAAPPGAQVVAGAEWSRQTGAQRSAVLTVGARAGEASRPARVAGIALPWHRMPLLAATHIVGEQGGAVREIREADTLGVQVLLPAPPSGEWSA